MSDVLDDDQAVRVRIRSLNKSFGATRALKDVSICSSNSFNAWRWASRRLIVPPRNVKPHVRARLPATDGEGTSPRS
ncbi:hypothetical protein LMG9964_05485 [Paraburkholderia phenoliruptrix]|uniref:Uncharacterized protein n=1 Tax=Paraburkholderia phenoliruptrix TaxID=252970 RepID=A0A6J5KCW5_9BURK|nr:hypothetical protein LMG9964_05485 [Paraburkholderia phenoliruptrix]